MLSDKDKIRSLEGENAHLRSALAKAMEFYNPPGTMDFISLSKMYKIYCSVVKPKVHPINTNQMELKV